MSQASETIQEEQLEFYLSVDKLLSAAEQVRRQRDRLLDVVRSQRIPGDRKTEAMEAAR